MTIVITFLAHLSFSVEIRLLSLKSLLISASLRLITKECFAVRFLKDMPEIINLEKKHNWEFSFSFDARCSRVCRYFLLDRSFYNR